MTNSQSEKEENLRVTYMIDNRFSLRSLYKNKD